MAKHARETSAISRSGLILAFLASHQWTSGGGANGYGAALLILKNSSSSSTGYGAEPVLYSFGASSSDEKKPFTGGIVQASGNLYGTTSSAGAYGAGTVGTAPSFYKQFGPRCAMPVSVWKTATGNSIFYRLGRAEWLAIEPLAAHVDGC